MGDFYIENKIYYHDTDCGGVVYYADYLKHLEEGRFQFCLSKGLHLGKLAREGVAFPVVRVEIEYKAPARYADTIRVYSRIEKIGTSSVHFYQEIKREDCLLVKAKTIWACVGNDLKSKAVPEEVKKALL